MTDLMRKARARIALLVAYTVVSLIVVVLFADEGHGSYAPPAILFSWGIVPWQHGLADSMYDFTVPAALYLSGLFVLNTALASSAKRRVSMIPIAIHIAGIIVALAGVEHGDLNTPGWLADSIIVSAPLAILYMTLDWIMLRKARREAVSRAAELLSENHTD